MSSNSKSQTSWRARCRTPPLVNVNRYKFNLQKADNNYPYSSFSAAKLKNYCKSRGIKRSGRKAALIKRLRDHDRDKKFKFLSLPPEVRNMIYGYATAEWSKTYTRYSDPWMRQPPLFQVCRQIREEGHRVFLEDVSFSVYSVADSNGKFSSNAMLESLGNHGLSKIRHLYVRLYQKSPGRFLPCLPMIREINTKVNEKAEITYKSGPDPSPRHSTHTELDLRGDFLSLGPSRCAVLKVMSSVRTKMYDEHVIKSDGTNTVESSKLKDLLRRADYITIQPIDAASKK